MEVLELNGKRYVKASLAAREAGYTSDYIGQLCRSGAIDAHLVGRSWYVDGDALRSHRIEKKRTSRMKARESVQKALATQKEPENVNISDTRGSNFLKRVAAPAVRYEEDASELLPSVKKLSVQSESPVSHTRQVIAEEEEDADENYTLEHEGEKVVMKGDLDLVDVTDEPAWAGQDDTIRMTAKVTETPKPKVKKKPARHTSRSTSRKLEVTESRETKEVKDVVFHTGVPSTFEQKLAEEQVNMAEAVAEVEDQLPVASAEVYRPEGSRIPIFSIATTVTIVLILFMSFLEGEWVYNSATTNAQGMNTIESNYSLNTSHLMAKIPFKI